MHDFHSVPEPGAAATGIVDVLYSANKRQRKDYTFWHQFSEMPNNMGFFIAAQGHSPAMCLLS